MSRSKKSAPSTDRPRTLKPLQPALPRQYLPPQPLLPLETSHRTNFYSLPAELRLEIYRLALRKVTIHILPSVDREDATSRHHAPHALLRTSREIRAEVQPFIHSTCPIHAAVTDFDFAGLLTWLHRIPAEEQKQLVKNGNLSINLCTTKNIPGDLPTLRRWLHDRADGCRVQPTWLYWGPRPCGKISNDLRRRVKRMKEVKKKRELARMLVAIGVLNKDAVELGLAGGTEDEGDGVGEE